MRWSWYVDLYQLEHRVVRARNYLNFRLQRKDSPERAKVFVVGHPRTGTKSLHKLFLANGLRSEHTSGNWHTRHYDCFSDRGNFQPFELMDAVYPNAAFVLNTRPVYNYLRSVTRHRFGRGRKSSGLVEPSVRNLEHEIIERNRDFLRFVRHFRDKANFCVANIERPESLAFVAERLGLQAPDIANRPGKQWRDQDLAKIDRAFANLGLDHRREEPLVLEELLDEADRALYRRFLTEQAERILL